MLLKAVELCHGKECKGAKINDPQKYYARMTSLTQWSETLQPLKQLQAATGRP
ncbi:hypothetical protein [Dietzia sp. SYD-A1]|uniref:hypothetical protein n=1 Tax=Dietzia sp. SYD-A1 TaxID=2780141 RepID=UPI001890D721|nr:hypothetical protein [Dietzia sp. SYD-A1]